MIVSSILPIHFWGKYNNETDETKKTQRIDLSDRVVAYVMLRSGDVLTRTVMAGV